MKIMRLFAIVSVLLGIMACSEVAVNSIDPAALFAAGTQEASIIDVRSAEDYSEGCIPGAVNVEWKSSGFKDAIAECFEKGQTLYLYSADGKSSETAAKALAKAGYEVCNILGGYEAWEEAELPVDLDPKYAADLIQEGEAAPDFELEDIQGNKVKLSDFRGKNVVLVFWASWCPDCRAEVPDLKAMYAMADPDRYQFVSISFDKDLEVLRQFVAENELPGVQLFDPAGKKDSKVNADFHVKWIPSLYLIDPEGKVSLSTVMAWKIAAAIE